MTYEEEQELLKLTKENNLLLKYIVYHISHSDEKSFGINLMANLIYGRFCP